MSGILPPKKTITIETANYVISGIDGGRKRRVPTVVFRNRQTKEGDRLKGRPITEELVKGGKAPMRGKRRLPSAGSNSGQEG